MLLLKQSLPKRILVLSYGRVAVERSHIDLADLWSLEDLPQRPHEGPIDPHELLLVNTVCLVEDDPHLRRGGRVEREGGVGRQGP